MKGSRRKVRPGVWELRVHAGTSPVTGKPKYVSKTFYDSVLPAEYSSTSSVPCAQKYVLDVM
jgi:hypothetical protein